MQRGGAYFPDGSDPFCLLAEVGVVASYRRKMGEKNSLVHYLQGKVG